MQVFRPKTTTVSQPTETKRNWLADRRLRAAGVLSVVALAASTFALRQQATKEAVTVPHGQMASISDLLTGQDWSQMAGAVPQAEGVLISPIERAIVNQDGTPNQSHPAVNMFGPHAETSGDFVVRAELARPAGAVATISLYRSLPVVYDEWRAEPAHVAVNIYDTKLEISAWDGAHDEPVKTVSAPVADGQGRTALTIARSSGSYKVQLNNGSALEIPASQAAADGEVWFGASAEQRDWKLRQLSLDPVGKGSVKAWSAPSTKVTQSPDGLGAKAATLSRPIAIGVAVSTGPLQSNNRYRSLVGSEFTMLTPENEMKAQFIHPLPGVYAFQEADGLVEFALANGMKVHGHTLVFGEANPAWMRALPLQERKAAMVDHIARVVGHYKGKVAEWDVVNEPLAEDELALRTHIWQQAMGESYIDTAFAAAKAADPNTKLFINEFGLEQDGERWDYFLQLIDRLQARGVPIDGVGFQTHVHEAADVVDKTVLAAHMAALTARGIESRISEIDVYGDNAKLQADQYRSAFEACAAATRCTSFATWGLTDAFGSTTESHQYPLQYGNDLLWDRELQPKAAYTALRSAIK